MPLKQDYAPAVAQNSFTAMLTKNWGAASKPGGATFENATTVAGTPVTILNQSNGPGVITSMWMTCAPPASGATQSMLNGLLQVYVDGEATPSVSFDVGGPLAYYQYSSTASFKTFTQNFMTETSFGGAATMFNNNVCNNIFLPIPYQASITIKFLPTQASTAFFFNVRYASLGARLPFKLFSQCTTYDNSIGLFPTGNQWTAAQLGNGSVKLLNVPGGSGYIAYAWLYFLAGAASLNTLNCDVNTYLNGNAPGSGYLTATPDITAPGIDGFFRYAYSSSAAFPMAIPQAAITNASAAAGTFHGALDIAKLDGGWRFTNGAVMQLESGQAGNGGNSASAGSGVLYYMDLAA